MTSAWGPRIGDGARVRKTMPGEGDTLVDFSRSQDQGRRDGRGSQAEATA